MILAGGLATFLLFFSEPIMEEVMEETKTMEDLLLVEGARGRFYCACAKPRASSCPTPPINLLTIVIIIIIIIIVRIGEKILMYFMTVSFVVSEVTV